MAILSKNNFKTKTIQLEGIEGGTITIKDDISYKTINDFNTSHKDQDKMTIKEKEEYSMEFLKLYITDWNLTDEKEVKLPITVENLQLLGIKDFQIVNEEIANTMKKKEK